MIVNMNGDTRERLEEQMWGLDAAIMTMGEAMSKAVPHGRNYPDGKYVEDRALFDKALAGLRDIIAYKDHFMLELSK